ncbi:hypothetical protein [Shewanella avicenniae]|nr:hypothetical protein [Shewanella avicenniae]
MDNDSSRYLKKLSYAVVVVLFLVMIFGTLGKAAVLVFEHLN